MIPFDANTISIEQTLINMLHIDGAMAVAIVDANTGFMLGSLSKSREEMDLEYASASNTELYHAKQRIMKSLGINEKIEDFLITLETQYHILVPANHLDGIFVYFVLSKNKGTLALARRRLKDLILQMEIV
ncbi:hypothetical protein JF634_03895 [Simonsiella muelleri]|jgi:hypothetical protein|uniref:Roadblock/LAMTOR2 domain-containing protein n=1 Tax=Simonsiella muelleri ATCC 29453 TaxID=641147 RepID=V9H9P7_9NEIS|nr:hypothetical protein [Simonsiella muelleri]AUX60537.1 hypothetical protein BWP33_00930 [Simonsiella muelleri ATCC 29453]EFG31931.2 hypothetical protein HMPREF9021_00334 [Simonsiella muelleri ATCC 29453]UBQ54643.1 hypothetical protein JF634_03895 [Simonsiella muelleri]